MWASIPASSSRSAHELQPYVASNATLSGAGASSPKTRSRADPRRSNDRMEARAMLYVGVDLHRKHSVVAALDEAGTPLLSRRIVLGG